MLSVTGPGAQVGREFRSLGSRCSSHDCLAPMKKIMFKKITAPSVYSGTLYPRLVLNGRGERGLAFLRILTRTSLLIQIQKCPLKKKKVHVCTHTHDTQRRRSRDIKTLLCVFVFWFVFFLFFERACCDAHFPQGVGPFRVLTQTLCPLGLTQTLCPGHWAAAAARTLQNLRNAIVFMGISNSERYLADLTGFWKLPKAI